MLMPTAENAMTKRWHKLSEYAIRWGEEIPDGLSQRQREAREAACPTVAKVRVRDEEVYEAWKDGKVIYRGDSVTAKKTIEGMGK